MKRGGGREREATFGFLLCGLGCYADGVIGMEFLGRDWIDLFPFFCSCWGEFLKGMQGEACGGWFLVMGVDGFGGVAFLGGWGWDMLLMGVAGVVVGGGGRVVYVELGMVVMGSVLFRES